jgi:hypothetical protein
VHDGLIKPLLLIQGEAQVLVGFRIVGLEAQRLFVMTDRLADPALGIQRCGQVVVDFGGARLGPCV